MNRLTKFVKYLEKLGNRYRFHNMGWNQEYKWSKLRRNMNILKMFFLIASSNLITSDKYVNWVRQMAEASKNYIHQIITIIGIKL